MRNLPGVDLCHIDRLNLLLLAPGGHVGRFCVWTSGAFAKLDALYGGVGVKSELKKDYSLPRPCMLNADLARLINSDEIQSVVRPAEKDTQRPKAPKRNPLKCLDAMLALNPYHEVHRASEMRAAKAQGFDFCGKFLAFLQQRVFMPPVVGTLLGLFCALVPPFSDVSSALRRCSSASRSSRSI